MTTAPLRIGIIGLGAIGQWMLQRFVAEPATIIQAVCDINAYLAAQTAAQLGHAAWSTDYRVMLAGDQVDLVYVAVPPRDHHRIILDVLAAGKHILCEKPLTLRLIEAQDLLAHARTAGVVHALHLPAHYAPGMRVLGAQLADGILGELRRIEIALVFPQWPRPWQLNLWVGSREQGGPIREVAPHLFEIILRYFGPIRRVWAHMEYPPNPTACEQGAMGLLELVTGPLVSLSVLSNLPRPEAITLIAYGTRGSVGLDHQLTPMRADADGVLKPIPIADMEVPSMISELVRAIRGEPADLCDFEIGLAIQAILDAWERAATIGTWVAMDT